MAVAVANTAQADILRYNRNLEDLIRELVLKAGYSNRPMAAQAGRDSFIP